MRDVQADVCAWLREAGLAEPDETPVLTPLAGGVSSDVFRIDLRRGPVCLKRALAQLKVAAEWRAPPVRSANEAAWLRLVGQLPSPIVPRVMAEDPGRHLFVMSWFDPAQHANWKTELASGRIDVDFARAVGAALAGVHAATADRPDVRAQFETTPLFESLRVEPYLRHTALKNPDLAGRLGRIVVSLLAERRALVHGDVSPKNILMGGTQPIFLDAECAWYGDPAFDIAFCANHLLLKQVWKPEHATGYQAAYEALTGGYLAAVSWEAADALEARAAPLLAGLLLARVDGKSPVEYLTAERDVARVRSVARELLSRPQLTLAEVAQALSERRCRA